jgi:sterol desaturase/sphingolipid hydroxylase (fatty acid hydroxylase superfamily)
MGEFVASQLVNHVGSLAWMIALMVAFGTLECLFPAEACQTLRGRVRNCRFVALYQLGGGVAASALAYWLVPLFVLPTEPDVDRSGIQTAALVILYLFASDLVFYWYHRAQHAIPALWVLHELHHSDHELNVTTSLRTYFLERPIQFTVISLPIAALVSQSPALTPFHLSVDEAQLTYVVSLVWVFFAHTNVRLQFGGLSWIATAPQVHRLHHSIEAEHQRKNFAQFFPILDIAFGTYLGPKPGEFPKTGTGLSELSPGSSVIQALSGPFRHGFGRRSRSAPRVDRTTRYAR